MGNKTDVEFDDGVMKNSTDTDTVQVVTISRPQGTPLDQTTAITDQPHKRMDDDTIISISVGVMMVVILFSAIAIFVRIKKRHQKQRESSLEKISQAFADPRQYLHVLDRLENIMIRSADNRELLSRDIRQNYNEGFDFHNNDHRTHCQSTITSIPYYRRPLGSQSRKSYLSSLKSFIDEYEDDVSFDSTVKTSHSRSTKSAQASRQSRLKSMKEFLDEYENALTETPKGHQSVSPSLESVLNNNGAGKSVQTETSQLTEEQMEVLSYLAKIASELPKSEMKNDLNESTTSERRGEVADAAQGSQGHILCILNDLANLTINKFPMNTCSEKKDQEKVEGTNDVADASDHWRFFGKHTKVEKNHYNDTFCKVSEAINLPDCISPPKMQDIEIGRDQGKDDDEPSSISSCSSDGAQIGKHCGRLGYC